MSDALRYAEWLEAEAGAGGTNWNNRISGSAAVIRNQAAEITSLRAELAEAQKLARDDFDLRVEQRDERDRLRAALAQAGAGREPRELDRHGWVRSRADGAKARCGGPSICKHCQGEQLLIAAHPPPAQREPLSDEQLCSMRKENLADDDAPAWAYEKGVRDAENAHGITTSGTKGAA